MQSFFIEFLDFKEELPVYMLRLILYGNQQKRDIARNLLANLKEVKREESAAHPCEVKLTLSEPINETSLIPLLRQSGIHGFRLVEVRN